MFADYFVVIIIVIFLNVYRINWKVHRGYELSMVSQHHHDNAYSYRYGDHYRY